LLGETPPIIYWRAVTTQQRKLCRKFRKCQDSWQGRRKRKQFKKIIGKL